MSIIYLIIKFLLYPFSIVYELVTSCRNWLFDHNWYFKEKIYDKPIICVGNLTVGGTGKTPMVEYLIKVLVKEKKLSVLSRGYGRKTKGYLQIGSDSTALTVGDEPFQLYQKFKEKVRFYVCEKRVFGLDRIFETSDSDVVILDDAFQHRYVKAQLNILLTDYNRLFYSDLVLPSGRLRESRKGAKRADMVFVTKSPTNISSEEIKSIKGKIGKYTKENVPIYFSEISYDELVVLNGSIHKQSKIVLLSGIANPKPLISHVSIRYNVIQTLEFADHHNFNEKEIQQILAICKKDSEIFLLTTEKDYQRLLPYIALLKDVNFGYLPISFGFYGKEKEINDFILKSIQ